MLRSLKIMIVFVSLGLVICFITWLILGNDIWILHKIPVSLWPLRAQNEPSIMVISSSMNDILTTEEMVKDLIQLKRDLINVHPSTKDKTSERVEDAFLNAIRKIEQPLSLGAFSSVVSELLASLGDAHTGLIITGKRLPMKVKIIDEHWYVLDGPEMELGSEVVSIGFLPVQDIANQCKNLFSYENSYWFLAQLESNGLSEALLSQVGAYILNGQTIVVLEKDEEQSTHYLFFDYQASHTITDAVMPNMEYYISQEDSYCYIFMPSARYDESLKISLGDVFCKIGERGIKALIIDLRNNSGGDTRVIEEFLKYLEIDEYTLFEEMVVRLSKAASRQRGYWGRGGVYSVSLKHLKNKGYANRFSGQIYVLVNYATFSTGVDFAVVLSEEGLARIIGTPTGGKPTSYGDTLFFQLNNSGLPYTISHKKFIKMSTEHRHADALYPDHQITYTLEDVLTGRDLEMEKALDLIHMR